MAIEPRTGRRAVTRRSRPPRIKPDYSPYFGIDQDAWAEKTRDLIHAHPVDLDELISAVLESWSSIFESTLGSGFKIGTDIFPGPQLLGFLLHELVPLELERLCPGVWQRDTGAGDKDLVYVDDDTMSIEIKTSSTKNQIFANRSYGQPDDSQGKKDKSGYYLAVNFERWKESSGLPLIRLIRFGWLDHVDWHSQVQASGQQASLPPLVENLQLLIIYDESEGA